MLGLAGAQLKRKSTEATSRPLGSLDNCNGGQLSRHVNAAITASPQLTCYYQVVKQPHVSIYGQIRSYNQSVSTCACPDAEE